MTRTFLVAIETSDQDLDALAADIQDSLILDNIPVTSVKPWASALTEPTEPTTFSGASA